MFEVPGAVHMSYILDNLEVLKKWGKKIKSLRGQLEDNVRSVKDLTEENFWKLEKITEIWIKH